MTTTFETTDRSAADDPVPAGHRWEDAGAAWGRRARDWACFFEHYATEAVNAVLAGLDLVEGDRLLDVACGSGATLRLAEARGLRTAGIDAAEPLVEIAALRAPASDLRVGTMFELPWADASFDAATAINGIWGDCDGALAETYRVLRPGGRIGLTYWGRGEPLDLRATFKVFARHSPASHRDGMVRTNEISHDGVAEQMLEGAGFDVVESGRRVSELEWPDPETAWRAIASVGPAVPALEHVGADVLRPLVLEALEPCRDRLGIYRFRNDHRFLIAEKPGA